MRKATAGALIGLCLGAVLGYVAFSAAYDNEIGGWTFYSPYTTVPALPGAGLQPERPWFSLYGLVGIVHGGGLAAIAGAVIGGVGAIVEAIRENRRFGFPRESQQAPASGNQADLKAGSS